MAQKLNNKYNTLYSSPVWLIKEGLGIHESFNSGRKTMSCPPKY